MNRSAKDNIFHTHYSLTEQFLRREFFLYSATVLEPACGKSCISAVLNKNFAKVVQYDINHPVSMHRADFYKEERKFKYIITNPPYGKETDNFVMKAKQVCTDKFAFLLRTNYLSGQTRYNAHVYAGLSKVYIFTRMPDLRAEIRLDGKYPTAGIVYAWFVWEKDNHIRNPIIKWIDNQKYVLKAGE